MPAYRPCASCGQRCRVNAASAAVVTCRECRRRLCVGCGQPFTGRHGGRRFCSEECRDAAGAVAS